MIFNLDSSGSAGSDSGSAVGSGLSLKVESAGTGSGTINVSGLGSWTNIGASSHTWSDSAFSGLGSVVDSSFRSLAGFGTGSGFMLGVWRSEEGLGISFEAGGVTGMRMCGDRMMKVH